MLETKLISCKVQICVVTCPHSVQDNHPLVMKLSEVTVLLAVMQFDPCKGLFK